MKKEFKVGDRVAVYKSAERYVGKVTKVLNKEFYRDGLQVEYPQHGGLMLDIFDVKQCRRLKNKKRRKVWIAQSALEHESPVYAFQTKINGNIEFIEFIEVRKKK